ncbi:MAG: hypothetical protein COS92_03560 [Desulfobacterales bacterium CG07_land_8_20_14_0_80_52_14]|nr:MAG: hypothetical protein COS92_03560 [Desulfobacterales bacterium CG07_land_8_20_14_0_80_52_14]PJB37257.1 MAG: hypothetical protein CO107_05355 [Deltaproteobacteria bacterium CG_4_9_14_3_um_filter_51_14]
MRTEPEAERQRREGRNKKTFLISDSERSDGGSVRHRGTATKEREAARGVNWSRHGVQGRIEPEGHQQDPAPVGAKDAKGRAGTRPNPYLPFSPPLPYRCQNTLDRVEG